MPIPNQTTSGGQNPFSSTTVASPYQRAGIGQRLKVACGNSTVITLPVSTFEAPAVWSVVSDDLSTDAYGFVFEIGTATVGVGANTNIVTSGATSTQITASKSSGKLVLTCGSSFPAGYLYITRVS